MNYDIIQFNPQAGNGIWTTSTSNRKGRGKFPPAYLQCCNFWTVQDTNTMFFTWCVNIFLYVYLSGITSWYRDIYDVTGNAEILATTNTT